MGHRLIPTRSGTSNWDETVSVSDSSLSAWLDASAVVRVATGLLLLTAGTLKLHELWLSGGNIEPLIPSTLLAVALATCEMTLAAWLVLGYKPRGSRWAAVACFVSFAAFALYRALVGAASCGCFGAVQVNPWWTLGLDVFVVAAYLVSRPGSRRQVSNTGFDAFRGLGVSRLRAGMFILVIVSGFVWIVASRLPAGVSADGALISGRQVAIFDPGDWIGKRLPILGDIDIGNALSTGSWTVVFYHHDCPDCQELLGSFANLSADTDFKRRTALVEIPPYGALNVRLPAGFLQAKLQNDRDWFIRAPREVRLQNGRVIEVNDDRVEEIRQRRSG